MYEIEQAFAELDKIFSEVDEIVAEADRREQERKDAEYNRYLNYCIQLDTRNAPRHWFVAVKRAPLDSPALIVHNEFEWQEALTALRVLNA